MNDFVVSPNGDVCMYRYINITMPGYERPSQSEFELMELCGYEYKGASECFSNSVYLFEFKHGPEWHEIQAHNPEEALEKALATIR